MNAKPQPALPDYSETANAPDASDNAPTGSLADAIAAGTAKAPPHLLWETLETAFAPPAEGFPEPHVERLPPYVALPIIVGSSLTLWAVIIEVALRR